MAALLTLTGCTTGTSASPQPPLALPFDVQKSGNKVETNLHIAEHREYIVSLRFGFKKDDQEDRARVKQLVGDDGQIRGGNPGIPTPLKVKIDAIDNTKETPIFQREVLVLRLRSWGTDNFEKHVAYVPLKPGHYRIIVESLRDVPELKGIPIALTIGFYAKASPIKD